ncbi:MAG: low molecular weight phosphotyrosine protein phosphatase [Lachnospiraceae bacterium]|nr:low molecular weight phosphotyrosine protein phosphatase [Lachnospiraceae bacterium]
MIRILFVCHGNICRSPMAEFTFKDMVEKKGLCDRFLIESAATSSEEVWRGVGNPINPPAAAVLKYNDIGLTPYTNYDAKRARQITKADYDRYDYIIGMDRWNVRNMTALFGGDPQKKVHMLLDYTGIYGREVADPWYTNDYEMAFSDIKEGCEALMKYLLRKM